MEACVDGYTLVSPPANTANGKTQRRSRWDRAPASIGVGLEQFGALGGLSGDDLLVPNLTPTVALTRIVQMLAAAEGARLLGPMLDTLVKDLTEFSMDFLYSDKMVVSMRDYDGVQRNLPPEITQNAIAAVTNFLPKRLRLPTRLTESQLEEMLTFDKFIQNKYSMSAMNFFGGSSQSPLPESVDPKNEPFWEHKTPYVSREFNTALELAQIRHETWKALYEIRDEDGRRLFDLVTVQLKYKYDPSQDAGVGLHYDEKANGPKLSIEKQKDGSFIKKPVLTLDTLRFIVAVSDTKATLIPDCDMEWGTNMQKQVPREAEILRQKVVNNVYENEMEYFKVADVKKGRECPDEQAIIKMAQDAPALNAGHAVGGPFGIIPHSTPVRDLGDVWMIVTLFANLAKGSIHKFALTTEKVMEHIKKSDFFKNRGYED